MNDDQLLLANAYLDDEIDDDERARAEADVEVMAEVVRLRSLRDALRAVETPDGLRRDRSVAAALAAFSADAAEDDGRPGRAVVGRTVPVPLAQRPRRAWWGVGAAAAAAAFVLVVGGGVVLLGRGSGDDDDSGDSAALQEELMQATDAARAATAATGAAPAETASESTSGGGESNSAATEGAVDAVTPTTTLAAVAPSAGLPPVLNTPDELAGIVSEAFDDELAPPATCAQAGTYYGRAVFAATPVEVFATPTEVVAVDVTTCAVVARVGR